MRGLRLSGLVLLAACAACLLAVSSASASLPVVLPETGEGTKSKEVGGEVVFETSTKKSIKCKSTAGSTSQSGKTTLGSFHLELKECTSEVAGIKFKCTGLGDATGVILVLGEYHLVEDALGESEKNSLGVAVLYLWESMHLECAGGFSLVRVTGTELCLIIEPHVFKVLHEEDCEEVNGVGTDKNYWNDAGEEKHPGLTEAESESGEVKLALKGNSLILWLNAAGTANIEVAIMG